MLFYTTLHAAHVAATTSCVMPVIGEYYAIVLHSSMYSMYCEDLLHTACNCVQALIYCPCSSMHALHYTQLLSMPLHAKQTLNSFDLSKESLARLDPANKRTKQQPQHQQQQQAQIEEIALKKYPLKYVLPEADYTKGADNIFIREDEVSSTD
jgi:sensor histidine kinase YesM